MYLTVSPSAIFALVRTKVRIDDSPWSNSIRWAALKVRNSQNDKYFLIQFLKMQLSKWQLRGGSSSCCTGTYLIAYCTSTYSCLRYLRKYGVQSKQSEMVSTTLTKTKKIEKMGKNWKQIFETRFRIEKQSKLSERVATTLTNDIKNRKNDF